MAHIYIPSKWEVETEGSGVQGFILQLHSELEASLRYLRLGLKKKTNCVLRSKDDRCKEISLPKVEILTVF